MGLLINPIPNSLYKLNENHLADSKENNQNSTTSEHFQKWPKNQGVVLALSLSITNEISGV